MTRYVYLVGGEYNTANAVILVAFHRTERARFHLIILYTRRALTICNVLWEMISIKFQDASNNLMFLNEQENNAFCYSDLSTA